MIRYGCVELLLCHHAGILGFAYDGWLDCVRCTIVRTSMNVKRIKSNFGLFAFSSSAVAAAQTIVHKHKIQDG